MKTIGPILMSTDMVYSNHAGIKTETRRTSGLDQVNILPSQWAFPTFHDASKLWTLQNTSGKPAIELKCPYGNVGDVLYVKETLFVQDDLNVVFNADGAFAAGPDKGYRIYNHYRSKNEIRKIASIFMHKELARSFYQITDIHLEPLNAITREGALAEGIKRRMDPLFNEERYWDYLMQNWRRDPVESYMTLFAKINTPELVSHNPWVWVIKYRVISNNGMPNCTPKGFEDKEWEYIVQVFKKGKAGAKPFFEKLQAH